jgi:prepilin-type N-terminal cleavage/methylation domain-containing protein
MGMIRATGIHKRRNRTRTASSSGFTLIEIMVVLVLLVIGIFAVIRLFPPGFLTIARTAEVTAANALVENQLNAQKNELAVAESIISINPGTGAPDPTIMPDDLRDFAPGDPGIGVGVDPYFASNINRGFTHIVGETFRIPVPNANVGKGNGAIHALQFGPVVNFFFTDPSNNPADNIIVKGAPLQRTEQSSVPSFSQPSAVPILRSEAQYAIDYDNRKIAFYPRVGIGKRVYVLGYSYYYIDGSGNVAVKTPNPGLITVPDVAVAMKDIPLWQKIFADVQDPNGAVKPADFVDRLGLERRDEDVSRKFTLKTPLQVATMPTGAMLMPANNPSWSNDPYEYAWYTMQTSTTSNPGVLIFNPIGHNQVSQTSIGNEPLIARVDYTTFDNHIIRDDRSVPSQAPYSIRLSLPFVVQNGDVLDITAAYNNFDPKLNPFTGLFRDNMKATQDIMIFNMSTGDEVGEMSGGVAAAKDPADPSRSLVGFTLDAKTGVIVLNQADVNNLRLQSSTLRFFYRTQKDWGMQVQKASAHYLEAPTATTDYRHYYIGNTVPGTGIPTRIYFAPCDAGKTVVLGECFIQVNGSPNPLRLSNEAYQITEDREPTLGLPYVDVKTQHPDAVGFSYTTTGRAVSNVQGGSLKSRAAWRSSQRWRKIDNDTFLLQTPIR